MAPNHAQKQSGPRRSTHEKSPRQRPERFDYDEREGGASRYPAQIATQLRDLTYENTGAAVLLALGAGVGVGFWIASSVRPPRIRQRNFRDRLLAEGLGRRLLERAESLLPEAVSDRLGLG
jgi:hypothetical protein